MNKSKNMHFLKIQYLGYLSLVPVIGYESYDFYNYCFAIWLTNCKKLLFGNQNGNCQPD